MFRASQILFLGTLIATASLALAAQDSINLRIYPKKGDSFKYKHTISSSIHGLNGRLTWPETTTVLEEAENVISTVSSVSNVSVLFDDAKIQIADMGEIQRKYNLDGTVKEIKEKNSNSNSYREAAIQTIYRPEAAIAVGDQWTWTAEADPKKGTRAMIGSYKAEAIAEAAGEKVIMISMEVKETEGEFPASSKGHVWLEVSKGILVKSETEVKNAPTDQAPPGMVSGRISIELIP